MVFLELAAGIAVTILIAQGNTASSWIIGLAAVLVGVSILAAARSANEARKAEGRLSDAGFDMGRTGPVSAACGGHAPPLPLMVPLRFSNDAITRWAFRERDGRATMVCFANGPETEVESVWLIVARQVRGDLPAFAVGEWTRQKREDLLEIPLEQATFPSTWAAWIKGGSRRHGEIGVVIEAMAAEEHTAREAGKLGRRRPFRRAKDQWLLRDGWLVYAVHGSGWSRVMDEVIELVSCAADRFEAIAADEECA